MTVEELKKALKGGRIPFLILAGEEEYLKRYYLSSIRSRLVPDEGLAPFNHIRFEGNEIDFGRLLDALKTPPVFAEEKLIEWHLCDFDKMKADDLSRLRALCEEKDSYEGITLVFYAEEGKLQFGQYPKRPSTRYTALSEFIDIVWFPPSTDAQLINWILRHFEKEKLLCSRPTAEALLSRVGHSMDMLSGEIEKLSAYCHANGRAELSAADINTVSASTFEADAFGLSNAILSGNATLAYENLRDMKNRRQEPTMIFGSVFRVFCDLYAVALLREEGLPPDAIREKIGMHEYKLKLYLRALTGKSSQSLSEILERCRRLDLSAKLGVADYSGLERLIAETSRT